VGAHHDQVGCELMRVLDDAARHIGDGRGVYMGLHLHLAGQRLARDAFEDGAFDRVLSTFGVQFAPRHAEVARELARVCRPGGVIGLVNWTPEGQVGKLFAILGRYLPAPPAFASPPPKWGDEGHVRGLFAGTGVELEFERGVNPLSFESSEDYVAFMEGNYGPTVKARERLSGEGRWDECRAEIVSLMDELNTATDGRMHVDAEYLLIVGRKLL